jgi:hypothetical protein
MSLAPTAYDIDLDKTPANFQPLTPLGFLEQTAGMGQHPVYLWTLPQERAIRRIVALVSVWVSKRIQTALELRPLCDWNLDVCQHPPVIGAMVAVWKSEMFQLSDSLLRNFRSAPGLEVEDQLILEAGRVPGQHIAHVQLGHLVVAHVEHRIAHPFFWGIFSALSKPLPDSAVRLIERIINISNAQMGDVATLDPRPLESVADPIFGGDGNARRIS